MPELYWSATTNSFHSDVMDGPRTLLVDDPAWQPDPDQANDTPPQVEVPNRHTTIPSDAVAISEHQREQLLEGQNQGLILTSDENGYPILEERPPVSLEELAAQKRQELDQARDDAFSAGLEYNFNGQIDVVQTRPQDKINLLGLSAKAQRLIAAGQPDATLTFRGGDNVNRELTATEIDRLTLAALKHIETIYQKSWELKDLLQAALMKGSRDKIEQLIW